MVFGEEPPCSFFNHGSVAPPLCSCCKVEKLKNRFLGLKKSDLPEICFMGAVDRGVIVPDERGGSSKLGQPSLFQSTQLMSR
jgi:hypothetical protein